MYKIAIFNVREEEKAIAENWAKNHQVDLTIHGEALTTENVSDLKDYDGLSLSQVAKIDSTIYEALANVGIKQIAQRSAGVDMYDLELAKQHNIQITNVPVFSPESIAEWTVFMAGNLVRNYDLIQERSLEGNFSWTPEIRGRVIGKMKVAIIGTGHIGMAAAKFFKGLGSQVVGYDLYPKEDVADILSYAKTVEEAIAEADIVSIHMPLTDDNYHLFNYDLFKQFKPGAYLINTARGGIVDTNDLLKALDEGLITGAALDTYEGESPYVPKDNSGQEIEDAVLKQLINHPQIIYTPHVAFYTYESVKNQVEGGLNATLEVLETGDSKNRVN